MKVYTKGGDKGTTSLVGGSRVPKDDLRVEAYGTVDELMANIALLHDNMLPHNNLGDLCVELEQIQNTLMTAAAILATDTKGAHKLCHIKSKSVEELEHWIDRISAELTPITNFTLAGGNVLVSQSHICRTVCRRAERRIQSVAAQYVVDQNVAAYINRLSDYLYVLGRKLTQEFNVKERLWVVEK